MKMYTVTAFAHRPFGPQDPKIPQFSPLSPDFPLILEVIRTEQMKPQIERIRYLNLTDPALAQSEKGELPIILFAGEFNSFSKHGLIRLNGLICLDFDHIPASEMSQVWQQLTSDPYTTAAFMSPRGFGYKVIVQLDNNTSEITHKRYFNALKDHYNSPYWDNSVSDISRACFLSSDPNLYFNPEAAIWNQLGPAITLPQQPWTIEKTNPFYLTTGNEGKVIRFLEGGWKKHDTYPMTKGNRHNSTFFRSRELFEYGLEEIDATNYFIQFLADDFNAYEAGREIRRAYYYTIQHGTYGTKCVPPMSKKSTFPGKP